MNRWINFGLLISNFGIICRGKTFRKKKNDRNPDNENLDLSWTNPDDRFIVALSVYVINNQVGRHLQNTLRKKIVQALLSRNIQPSNI